VQKLFRAEIAKKREFHAKRNATMGERLTLFPLILLEIQPRWQNAAYAPSSLLCGFA
jgi:hypothetical protein